MRKISRGIFLKYVKCQVLGWFMRQGKVPRSELSQGDLFFKEQQKEVQRKARDLYPGGVYVEASGFEAALEKTRQLMRDPETKVIYKPVFESGEFRATADILNRTGSGWELVEVRPNVFSSKISGGVRPDVKRAAAYAYYVIEKNGIEISRVSILTISKDCSFGTKTENLFVKKDFTDDVRKIVSEQKPKFDEIEKVTGVKVKPNAEESLKCRNCAMFVKCTGRKIKNHIFDIPQLNDILYGRLKADGIKKIEDIKKIYMFSRIQKMVIESVKNKNEIIARGFKTRLRGIKKPFYYLDFEAMMTAVPVYPNTAPYENLPVQYSVHVCDKPGNIINHFEYLADPKRDSRLELAVNLIGCLGNKGSIITFSSFEKEMILRLAVLFPQYAEKLNILAKRIIDLADIVKKYYYHPGFHGRLSLKTILPVLVSRKMYNARTKIDDGASAMAAFFRMASGKADEKEIEESTKNLLKYCKNDTLALVLLHKYLVGKTINSFNL